MTYPESLKDPLPSGESYPLRRSILESALSEAGVTKVDLIYFLRAGIQTWQGPGPCEVLDVLYRAETRDHPDRLEVRIHAVPSDHRASVEGALLSRLPEVARWIAELEMGENVRRGADHRYRIEWSEQSLVVSED